MRKALVPWLLLAPAAAVLVGLFAIPLGGLAAESFTRPPPFGIATYTRFFGDSYYLGILARTFGLAALVTLLCVVCGFPLAFWLARLESRMVPVLLLLASFPLWVSSVVRTFGWMVLFVKTGVLSRAVRETGLVDANFQFMGSFSGVVIALTQVLLPLMVLTLYGVIRSIDRDLEYAAMNLGARPFIATCLVTLRLSAGGIVAGSLLVFSFALGAFATPSLIGGTSAHFMSVAIADQTLMLIDWPFAAAMSTILLVFALVVALLYSRILKPGTVA
jgi:ABC-type spermidine/putrescine transport system permease subunit I